MKHLTLLKLFIIFVKVGAILLGGGYVILPILENELAVKRKLVSKDELVNYFTLSQSLPGIIAANMTMFIGYKLKGKSGTLAAMLGVIFVPFWCIVLLASVLGHFVNNSYVQGAMWGVSVAVIALILLTARDMWQNSKRTLFFYSIFLLSLISLLIFKLSPVSVIIIYSLFGLAIKLIGRGVNKGGKC